MLDWSNTSSRQKNQEQTGHKIISFKRKNGDLTRYAFLEPSLVSQNDLRAISKSPSIPALTAKHCCVRATKGTRA